MTRRVAPAEPRVGSWAVAYMEAWPFADHAPDHCCVISTALPAANAGATLTVVTDACAGSTPANHRSALDGMTLHPPQITLRTTDEFLQQLGA
ncbi:MAG: isochorismatase family protein [Actinomycetota bacterium]